VRTRLVGVLRVVLRYLQRGYTASPRYTRPRRGCIATWTAQPEGTYTTETGGLSYFRCADWQAHADGTDVRRPPQAAAPGASLRYD
jgi:hypothetical protein